MIIKISFTPTPLSNVVWKKCKLQCNHYSSIFLLIFRPGWITLLILLFFILFWIKCKRINEIFFLSISNQKRIHTYALIYWQVWKNPLRIGRRMKKTAYFRNLLYFSAIYSIINFFSLFVQHGKLNDYNR